ncbi:MAG: DUF3126 family protein [Hyphomicrobiales bacterium]
MNIQEVQKLDAYLKRVFGTPRIRVVPHNKDDSAEVFVGEEKLGDLAVDDEDEDRSYNFRMEFELGQAVDIEQNKLLDMYLRRKFDNERIRVMGRLKKTDSVEVYLDEEFIGVVFIENEKGRRSFILEMPILEMDLA